MISVNGNGVSQMTFPDGTPSIKFPLNTINGDWATSGLVDAYDITWLYDSMDELFNVICISDHIRRIHNARKPVVVNLFMPYIPNARMDRVHDDADIFTLKTFCNIINSAGFDKVTVLDPHSNVSEALLNNLEVQFPYFVTNGLDVDVYKDIDTFYFPDEGAMKRYSSNFNERPYVFGMKNRDWKTGEIKSLDIIGDSSLIKDKNILIIDDICSAGGTFYFSAKKLKELGAAKIYLYITHCENTILDHMDRLDGLIEKIYTTNSIYRGQDERIKVITI